MDSPPICVMPRCGQAGVVCDRRGRTLLGAVDLPRVFGESPVGGGEAWYCEAHKGILFYLIDRATGNTRHRIVRDFWEDHLL